MPSTNNKVKFGLKNCHYAKATLDPETNEVTFATPVAIPGAVNLSLDPEGDTEPFYADDMVYYTTVANNGYSGDLEIALIPDSFRKDILKETEDPQGVPDTPDEWLDQFGTFSIYQVLPEIIELWGLNVQTQVESKKNFDRLTGR